MSPVLLPLLVVAILVLSTGEVWRHKHAESHLFDISGNLVDSVTYGPYVRI
jgi:hypothetical protein